MATNVTQLNPWVLRANALACAGLAVAIGYVLVRMVYLFVDPNSSVEAPSLYGTTVVASSSQMTPQRRVDAGTIAQWHLFGEEGQKPVAQAQTEDVVAPPTRLALELQGVFVAPKEEDSTAMISESRKESQLYRIGSKVAGSATLTAVYADRVLLSINGKLEALYFPDAKGPGAGPGMTRSTPPPSGQPPMRSVSARTGRMTDMPPPGAGGGVPRGAMPGVEQAQEVINSLQAEISANPDAVLGQFGLATNNGRGYKVTDSSNPAFAAIGARPGDVLVSVNGRSLGDPQADVNLIKEVMESGCAKVVGERDGRQYSAEACP
ncbi:MAG TPA: type II secretion system protein N [Dongiaceae bacterium]|nr:type II secretion system protein N [Dongiaceae bacterium]